MLTRRTVLLGGVAVTTAAATTALGLRLTADDGDVRPGPVVRGTFRSRRRLGADAQWSLSRPPGVDGPLPLVVALHGHGGSTGQLLDQLRLPTALARAHAAGVPPFALATVSGGNGFWHRLPSGDDSGAMVVDELVPLLVARDDLAVTADRLGLLGWSMGGYGVLRLGGLLGRDRVAAVCAGSPGLYTDAVEAAAIFPDAFADAAEYERFTVFGHQAELAGIPVRIDCGTEDRFYEATTAYVEGFAPGADLTTDFSEGGHELEYTLGALPAELAWIGAHLS